MRMTSCRARARVGSNRMRLLLVVTMLICGLPLGCKRPCESALNCKRTCSCLNTQTNRRNDCTVAFKCDGAEQVCEEAFDTMKCDDLCAQYAARALCGTERCASDADCVKILECDCRGQDGNPNGRKYECTRSFLCDVNTEVCEPLSTRSDAEICAADCAQPAAC
jgi:hypothetical protein